MNEKINIGLNIQLFAAPTVTFAPLDNATGVVTDAPTITATFSEAVRNINDSAITDAMLPGMVVFKKTNGTGSNVPCVMSINENKTVVTIVPNEDLLPNQVYYVGILGSKFENATGEAVVATAADWTTSDKITLTGTSVGANEIVAKALVSGDVDGNHYSLQVNDEKTVIIAINTSADTAYDLTVKEALKPNYAGKDVGDLIKEIPFGEIALISVESARYADQTGKINIDVENAAIKLAVFYRK